MVFTSKWGLVKFSKIVVVFQMSILLLKIGIPQLVAQNAGQESRSPAIEVSLAMKKTVYVPGEKQVAVITVKNISSQDVPFPTSLYNYRVYVSGEKGEPPVTLLQRHKRGVFFPGDNGALADGGVTVAISPGTSQSKEFDLADYYNLSAPGKYTAYIEYREESGKWLRTNTVEFENQAAH
jgi:hypothetical protein